MIPFPRYKALLSSCYNLDDDLQEQEQRNSSLEVGKSVGDLNMKLKLEIGALRGENEGLQKKNDEVVRQVNELENQIQVRSIFRLKLSFRRRSLS